MTTWLLLALIAVLAFVLTGALRRYALARSIIDVPNARSSHSVPTPRGGGVAIVLCFIGAIPLLAGNFGLASDVAIALGGAGILVALIGFLDDHGHIAARWRLLAHFSAAAWALYWLGGSPPLALQGMQIETGALGIALAAIYLVWGLNLYNFMDGIDGIASVEAICVCVGGALIYWLAGQPGAAITPLALAAAVAGFLIWNFPPARIFMGDAGSGFLGITLGILSLQAGWVEPNLFWAWLVLLGVFVVDATFTLLRRLLRGEKVHEAHRSHAYQYASRRYGRHLPVTLTVLAINILWLMPIALAVGTEKLSGIYGLTIAYVPLILLASYFRAGMREAPPR
jgi:Fuc2NAc and GlcNAc transferase